MVRFMNIAKIFFVLMFLVSFANAGLIESSIKPNSIKPVSGHSKKFSELKIELEGLSVAERSKRKARNGASQQPNPCVVISADEDSLNTNVIVVNDSTIYCNSQK